MIRRAGLDDVHAVGRLFDAYRQFYDKPSDPALAQRFIHDRLERDESVIFIAPAAGDARRLVGFCQCYPTFCSVAAARLLVLYDLFVDPAARRTGAGAALMAAAENHATAHGFARMELQTARTNTAAQALYEARGWKRDDAFYVYAFTP